MHKGKKTIYPPSKQGAIGKRLVIPNPRLITPKYTKLDLNKYKPIKPTINPDTIFTIHPAAEINNFLLYLRLVNAVGLLLSVNSSSNSQNPPRGSKRN